MTVTNLTPPVITGTAQQGQTLTTSQGTWDFDEDYLTYAYQWLRCDAAGANCVDIVGSTTLTRLLTAADVGFRLRSEVTATEHASTPPTGLLLFEPPNYPTFAGYTTVNIANNGSNSFQNLDDSTDYIIVIDDYQFTEGITLIGGRNVVCYGGQITIDDSAGNPDPFGLALWPRNGAKHYIEGVRITPGASNLHLHDGIVVRHNGTYPSTSASRIVLQNLRVGPCSIKPGLSDSFHSDIIQYQSNYPGQLWTDRFTGMGDYNGLMYSNFSIGLTDYHNTNLRQENVHATYNWNLGFYQGIASSLLQLDEFYVELGPGKTLGNCVYPGTAGRTAPPSDGVSAATIDSDGISNYLFWANAASGITGFMRQGPPADGDFVTDGECGIGYVTPGYV